MRAVVVVLVASVAALACAPDVAPPGPPIDELPPGAQLLERLQYNDTNDVYRAFLVGAKDPLRLRGLRLALLSDEEIAAGKKPHLIDDGRGPVARLGPRYKIGVLHGVVTEGLDDDSERQNIVARTELRMWSPFLVPKDVDGKSVWLTPAYHFPPPTADGALVGSGAWAATREEAYDAYRRATGELPQAIRLELEGWRPADRVDAGPAASAPPESAKDNRVVGAIAGTKASVELRQRRAELRKQKNLANQKKKKKGP